MTIVKLTIFFSALSTFILPRTARSRLNRLVFGVMRRIFEFILHFTRTYEQRDAIMAYYSPLSLIMLVPVWYCLMLLGYAAMYWSSGVGDWFLDFRFSGSSLLTLGFATSDHLIINILAFSEALRRYILRYLVFCFACSMAFFTLTKGRKISPAMKNTITERIPSRRLWKMLLTSPNVNVPIQEVPRSLIS